MKTKKPRPPRKAEEEVEEEEAKEEITLNVMSSDDFAGFRTSVLGEFKEANPGLKINFQSVGYDALRQKEVTALAAGADTYDSIDVDCI